jgi:corrinoid protein of di/trimethylamine methyltransferase
MSDLFEKMREAVLEGIEEDAEELAKEALASNLELKDVMDKGFLKGIQEAGQLFGDGEYFLPDLLCAAEAMKVAMAVLEEELKKPSAGIDSKGKIVLATVQGDVHDIGKIIVASLFTASGYEVHDLGTDVPNEDVIQAVKDLKPNFLGLSALLTTTMEEQRAVVEGLKEAGVRDQALVLIGGAPVTQEWCTKISADGYADDAVSAVELASKMLKS